METLQTEWRRFSTTFVPNLSEAERGTLRIAFFSGAIALEKIVEQIHETGRSHDDLARAYHVIHDEMETFVTLTIAACGYERD